MTREQFNSSFVARTLGNSAIHCDEKEVDEGLEKLTTFINNADSVITNIDKCISDFRNLAGFYGVVQNNCLSEDNVLYDLDIPSYTKDDNTEHILDDFPTQTKDIKELLEKVKTDIKETEEVIKMFAESDKYSSEELKAAAQKISLFEDYERIQNEGGPLADTIAERNKIAEQITNGTFVNPKKLAEQQAAKNDGAKRATVGAVKTATPTPVGNVQSTSFKPSTVPETSKVTTPDTSKVTPTNNVNNTNTNNNDLAKDADKSFNNTNTDTKPDGKVSTGTTNIKIKPINKDDIINSETGTNKVPQNSTTTTGTSGTVHGGGGFNSTGYNFNGSTNNNTTQKTSSVTPISATAIGSNKTAEAVKIGTVKGTNFGSGEKGNLASSISSTQAQARTIGTISKIEKSIDHNSNNQEESTGFVLPTAAALSAASVAGIGTKVYVNQAAKDKEEKEKKNAESQRVVAPDVVTQEAAKIQDELDIEEKRHSSFDGFIIEENEL